MNRKPVLCVAIALLVSALGGCARPVAPDARRIAAEQAILQTRFVTLIDLGQVSGEQLIANARANAATWRAFNALLNPTSLTISTSPTVPAYAQATLDSILDLSATAEGK